MKFSVGVLFFIGLAVVCFAADPIQLSAEQKQKVRAAAGACITQEQVDKAAVQKLREGNFADADQKAKCFVNCFLEKLDFSANGTPQESVIREKLGAIVGQDKINTIIQQCNGLKGADQCDTAFKLYECYFKNHAALIQ